MQFAAGTLSQLTISHAIGDALLLGSGSIGASSVSAWIETAMQIPELSIVGLAVLGALLVFSVA